MTKVLQDVNALSKKKTEKEAKRREETTRKDQTSQEKIRQDIRRQDETRQDKTRQGKAQTRQKKATLDKTGRQINVTKQHKITKTRQQSTTQYNARRYKT